MAEDTTENLDSQNEEVQENTEEISEESTESTEEVDTAKLQATNKKLYERAKKAEEELKKLKQSKSELPESAPDAGSLYEHVSLLKNIEQDEMESLENDAKDLGVPVIKYLKSPAGKTRLDAIRKEKKSKEASPTIGASSPVYKKYTQADLSKMSVAELEKILPHAE